MKYIDAEKLIAEIERYENTAIDAYNPIGEDADLWHGKVVACEDLKTLVTSLQQEQPELPGYDKALLEVKRMVDKLYDEASIGLSEYDSGLYNGIAETCMKLRGFIKARLDSDEQSDKYETALEKAREWAQNVNQGGHAILIDIFPELGEGLDPRYGNRKQEQPVVDLEKEMNKLISLEYVNQPDDEWEMCIAHYFYELGLNARKEE